MGLILKKQINRGQEVREGKWKDKVGNSEARVE